MVGSFIVVVVIIVVVIKWADQDYIMGLAKHNNSNYRKQHMHL